MLSDSYSWQANGFQSNEVQELGRGGFFKDQVVGFDNLPLDFFGCQHTLG